MTRKVKSKKFYIFRGIVHTSARAGATIDENKNKRPIPPE